MGAGQRLVLADRRLGSHVEVTHAAAGADAVEGGVFVVGPVVAGRQHRPSGAEGLAQTADHLQVLVVEAQGVQTEVGLAELPAQLQAELAGVVRIHVGVAHRRQARTEQHALGALADQVAVREVAAHTRNAVLAMAELVVGAQAQGVREFPLTGNLRHRQDEFLGFGRRVDQQPGDIE
ncbi:hypothetical protein D3C85_1034050 [compost metagenome]